MIPIKDVDAKIQELLTELFIKCDCQNDVEFLRVLQKLILSVGLRINGTFGKDIALTVFNAVPNLIIELTIKKGGSTMKSIEEVNNSSNAAIEGHLMRCGARTSTEQLEALLNLGSTVGTALSAVAVLESIIDHVKSDNYTIQKVVVQ